MSTFMAALAGLAGTMLILILALVVFIVIINWKMFEKAGKPGWASIVPVYNKIILLEIMGYKWYYVFLFYIPVIPFVGQILFILFTISYSIKLAKSFGQSTGFGIGLAFLNPIFTAIIAFNKDINYVGTTVNGDIDFNKLF